MQFPPSLEIHLTVFSCPDFSKDLTKEGGSYALRFASYTLFEMRHLIKTAKKSGNNLVLRVRFNENTIVIVLGGCTTQPKFENNQLLLTTDEASLLAVTVLSKQVPVLLEEGRMVLTPLAEAVFSRLAIENIAVETKQDKASILISVIQSCQNGGQNLEMSDASIALVASVCATANMKNESLRNKFISRTYKQYAAVGKQIDEAKFWIYAQNTAVVPDEFIDNLTRILDEAQRTRYSGTNSDTAKVDSIGSTSTGTAAQDAKENPSVTDATNEAAGWQDPISLKFVEVNKNRDHSLN
uniref:Uncharacterized protein n=1 Tax=Glossina austeni TaxID=7395 RepID=A0A1A9URM1_GLOAU